MLCVFFFYYNFLYVIIPKILVSLLILTKYIKFSNAKQDIEWTVSFFYAIMVEISLDNQDLRVCPIYILLK